MGFIDWITANWWEIIEVLGLIVAAGAIIAKYTKTEFDNELFATLRKLIDWIGQNSGNAENKKAVKVNHKPKGRNG